MTSDGLWSPSDDPPSVSNWPLSRITALVTFILTSRVCICDDPAAQLEPGLETNDSYSCSGGETGGTAWIGLLLFFFLLTLAGAALLFPHKQTVPSMSTMSTEIVEASRSGQHQVTPV